MPEKKLEPLFRLPAETTRRLTAQEDELAKARKALATMKELGMDTTELENKLEWAENVRKTLLREFA